MNSFFYKPLSRESALWMNDPRGYLSPYLDAELEGEMENRVYFHKYMNLSDVSKNVLKIRLTSQIYRGF